MVVSFKRLCAPPLPSHVLSQAAVVRSSTDTLLDGAKGHKEEIILLTRYEGKITISSVPFVESKRVSVELYAVQA